MKVLGYVFVSIIFMALGYVICHFGWLEQLYSLICSVAK